MKTVKVLVGQSLPYDDTRYKTIQTGRIRVLKPSQIEAQMIGSVRRVFTKEYYSDKFKSVKLDLKPGMIVEYLQYRAEGSCFLRVDSKVLYASCLPNDATQFHVQSEPKTELWIHVTLGDSRGWLLVSDSTVKQVEQ